MDIVRSTSRLSRVLVTGASGFLGFHVVQAFRKRGWQVIAGARKSSDPWRLNRFESSSSRLLRVELDLLKPDTIQTALRQSKPHVVIHCAGYGVDYGQQDLDIAVKSNIAAVAMLVQSAAFEEVERFIHVGTCYEYGDHPGDIREDACLRPRGIYGITKMAGTLLALDQAAATQLPLTVVRPFGVYGPAEGMHKFVPKVIHACLSRNPLDLTSGEQIRDYLFVGDVARACERLAMCDEFPSGEVFNLGSGQPVTIRRFGETIAKVLGHGSEFLRWGALAYRRDEVMNIIANVSKARNILKWEAEHSVEEGLLETIAFERARQAEK